MDIKEARKKLEWKEWRVAYIMEPYVLQGTKRTGDNIICIDKL